MTNLTCTLRSYWAPRARRLYQSPYLRSIATLSSGQIIATIIPFLAAPLLGRIYQPEDYGLLAAYTAIANVAVVFSTLQYQQGIIAEKSDQRAEGLVGVCVLASGVAASLMLLIVIFLRNTALWSESLGGHELWIFMLPVTTFTMGAVTAATALANRQKRYAFMAQTQVVAAVAGILISITFGLLGYGVDGLMIAYFFSSSISFIAYLTFFVRTGMKKSSFRYNYLVRLAIKNRAYPLYTLPTAFISSLTAQLPFLVLSISASAQLLGSFARANQLVSMPVILLTGSVSRVYFQRAAKDYHDFGNCFAVFIKTSFVLFIAGLPPFIIIMLYGPSIFSFYLGENWVFAGEISQILAPMLFIKLWTLPINPVLILKGRQKTGLVLVVAFSFIIGGSTILPVILGLDSIMVIYAFVASSCTVLLMQFAIAWYFSLPQSGPAETGN